MTFNASKVYQQNHGASMNNTETLNLNLMDYRASFIFLFVNVIFLIPMFYLGQRIRLMVHREQVKKEDTVLSKVLKWYATLMPIAVLNIIVFVNVMMSFVYPVSEQLGAGYCYGFQLLGHASVEYLGIFSVITAAIRYKYVKKHQVDTPDEKERQKTAFLTLHILIPTIMPVLNFLINGDKEDTFWVSHCWGHNGAREADENETTVLYQIAEKFGYHREYHLESYVGSTGANIIEPLLQVTCGLITIFHLVYMINIVEIVLYLIIFRHVDR